MHEVTDKIMQRISKYSEAQQIGYGVFRDNVRDIIQEELSVYRLIEKDKGYPLLQALISIAAQEIIAMDLEGWRKFKDTHTYNQIFKRFENNFISYCK